MINKEEVVELVESFKKYRDMLIPIEENIHAFVDSYETMRVDIETLNKSMGADIGKSLKNISMDLGSQADKANALIHKIEEFTGGFGKYVTKINTIIELMEKLESRLNTLSSVEEKAETQLSKLETIIEEKQKTYNIKDLEKSLEVYNENVQKVSQFINEEIINTLDRNTKDISMIKSGHESIVDKLDREKTSIDKLIETYSTTNDMLKKIVEKDTVNEIYIFDMLDEWARSRNVKIKIKE